MDLPHFESIFCLSVAFLPAYKFQSNLLRPSDVELIFLVAIVYTRSSGKLDRFGKSLGSLPSMPLKLATQAHGLMIEY